MAEPNPDDETFAERGLRVGRLISRIEAGISRGDRQFLLEDDELRLVIDALWEWMKQHT